MDTVKVVAIILIVAGALGLVYQQFSFTKETHQAKIGPLELSVKEKETVNVPLWVSLGAIGVGWCFSSRAQAKSNLRERGRGSTRGKSPRENERPPSFSARFWSEDCSGK